MNRGGGFGAQNTSENVRLPIWLKPPRANGGRALPPNGVEPQVVRGAWEVWPEHSERTPLGMKTFKWLASMSTSWRNKEDRKPRGNVAMSIPEFRLSRSRTAFM